MKNLISPRQLCAGKCSAVPPGGLTEDEFQVGIFVGKDGGWW